jgi:alpha-tubulin suppressor-like RCC1 family protein
VYCFGRAPLIGVAKDTSCFNDRADDPRDVVACTLVPLRIASDIPMQSVAVGDSVACAITTALSGATPKAYCWGDDTFGELGNGRSAPGTSATPSLVVGPLGQAQTLTQIAAGRAHACGLAPSGLAYCWGRDSTYQLGGGDRRKINSSTPIPVAMPTGVTFTALVAGRSHSCGLAVDGTAYCWGYNHDGQLGYTTANDTSDVPTAVPGPKYIQLTAGARHTCGLTNLQTIYCWGANDSLQSGHAGAGTPTPVQVPGSGYFAVAAGWTHTCALQAGGIAVCWGGNDYGQLGRGAGTAGAPAMSAVPVPVAGGLVFGTISAGRRTSCAVAADGAYCWGSTVLGAMGSQLQALTVATPTKTATPQ